jgi:hypothetical protein
MTRDTDPAPPPLGSVRVRLPRRARGRRITYYVSALGGSYTAVPDRALALELARLRSEDLGMRRVEVLALIRVLLKPRE